MERLTIGTKEYLVVRVQDQLGNTSTLNGTSPKFDIRIQDDDAWVLQDQTADNDGMRVLCLVDTTGWDVGTYELFVSFTNVPEIPRLGPFEFSVS